jgi:two-component system response regulator GlrR
LPHRALIIDNLKEAIGVFSDEMLSHCGIAALNRVRWQGFTPASIDRFPVDVVLANATRGTPQAAELFRWLRAHPAKAAVFGILPRDDMDLLRLGAEVVDDFLVSPLHPEEFHHRIARRLGLPSKERSLLEQRLFADLAFGNIVGRDPAFVNMLGRLARFSASDAPVLLNGETGTGKELCARAVHALSSRRNGPFIPVECGALPEQLLENEIFGHVRGAYTGAAADQKGLVALARGGTLFLDEIDGVMMGSQGKLLRLLQERTFRPLGSEKFVQADVRIVAASNADLGRLVEAKSFRADLFFRLNVLTVNLPPLRRRPGDIAPLACKFMDDLRSAGQTGRRVLSPGAIRKLEGYQWPGNVRELYNTIQRAVLTSTSDEILGCHLELGGLESGKEPEISGDFRSRRALTIEAFEAEYVQRLLAKHGGNVTRAAREAGKERRAFGRLVKKYVARDFPDDSAMAVGRN